jgi:hypothetical protein
MDTQLQPFLLDPCQQSLFAADPIEENIDRLLAYLLDHKDEINELYEMSQKVLNGEPGYARTPRPQAPRPRSLRDASPAKPNSKQ